MSDETIVWGLTIIDGGQRRRWYDEKLKPKTWTSRQAAWNAAYVCEDGDEPRIVKITMKKKPRVVSRYEYEGFARKAIALSGSSPYYLQDDRLVDGMNAPSSNTMNWLAERVGKRVRITLEELSDT
jgi:hypothetical protein